MNEALVIVTFLCAVVVLAVLAKRFQIPYPIAFVIGGVGLAFAHNIPRPHFDPEVILLIVLPPLLYSAAWNTDWVELKRNWAPISMLAIGLVLFTTAAVAVVVHTLVPGYGWPLAFTLGAIVSPPDAVASEAIFERLAIPRRLAAIINGECLVNDATALVLYRFAVAAAVTGGFSIAQASGAFFYVALVGIGIGIAVALILEYALRVINRHGFDDATTGSVILLLAPFGAYLPAEHFHVSGVLAAVSAGIMLSQRSRHFIDSGTRLLSSATWHLLTYMLNAFAFLLIGLQLPSIIAELEPRVRDSLVTGLAICVAVIVVRFAWVFVTGGLERVRHRMFHSHGPVTTWQGNTVIGWAGMRGIVSLAAALALPYTLGEEPFPQRSETIFFTVCVVFSTLVLQGLTLGRLIAWLGVAETSKTHRIETSVRIRALQAGAARLRQSLKEGDNAQIELASRILSEYELRIGALQGAASKDEQLALAESLVDRRLQMAAIEAERTEITAMRRAGDIPDDVFRSIEYDLDLAVLSLD